MWKDQKLYQIGFCCHVPLTALMIHVRASIVSWHLSAGTWAHCTARKQDNISSVTTVNIIQLLGEAEQNIVIYQWRADQLFADAEGRGK